MKLFKAFILITLLTTAASAQMECSWGIRLYVRDNAGKLVENTQAEITRSGSEGYVPDYKHSNGIHSWIEYLGSGTSGNNLLIVYAKGFKKFEKIIKFPICGIQGFDLKLQPVLSDKDAVFDRLATLSINVENKKEESKDFRVILTDKWGTKFQYSREEVNQGLNVISGLYSLKVIWDNNFVAIPNQKLVLEKKTTNLKIVFKPKNNLNKSENNLICQNQESNTHLSDTLDCSLTIDNL